MQLVMNAAAQSIPMYAIRFNLGWTAMHCLVDTTKKGDSWTRSVMTDEIG